MQHRPAGNLSKMEGAEQKEATRCRRGRRRKKSPYFATNKGTTAKPKSAKNNNAAVARDPKSTAVRGGCSGSRHFLTAPSSAIGSVQSLGPFLSTLADGVARSDPAVSGGACPNRDRSSALDLLEIAARQFMHCSTFMDSYRSLYGKTDGDTVGAARRLEYSELKTDALGKNDLSMERLEQIMHSSVRHLCANGCYLRAYAPMRDWHALRAAVFVLGRCSPERLLQGWRCILVPPAQILCSETSAGNAMKPQPDEKAKEINTATRRRRGLRQSDSLVKTLFVAPSGKVCCSNKEVMRHLGLQASTSGSGKTKESSSPVPLRSKKRRRGTGESSVAMNSPSSVSDVDRERNISLFRPMHTELQSRGDHMETVSKCSGDYRLENDGHIASFGKCSPPLAACNDMATPFGLLEEIFVSDPWRLLLSTIMLNKTSRVQVDPVLNNFLQRWPDAHSAAAVVDPDMEMSKMIEPLGLWRKRSRSIIRFSKEYLDLIDTRRREENGKEGVGGERLSPEFLLTDKDILSLHNCGQYALDAYRMFIGRDIIIPSSDHALNLYSEYHRGCKKVLLASFASR